MHWAPEPRGKSKAPQRRRTPKPGGLFGRPRNQRASVLECGGAPPLSAGQGRVIKNPHRPFRPPALGPETPPAPPLTGEPKDTGGSTPPPPRGLKRPSPSPAAPA